MPVKYTCTILSMKLDDLRVNSLPDRRLVACINPVKTGDLLRCTIAELAPDGSTSTIGVRTVKYSDVDVVVYTSRFGSYELVYGDFQRQARIRYEIDYGDERCESDPITVGPLHGDAVVATSTIGRWIANIISSYTRFDRYMLLGSYHGTEDELAVAASLSRFYECPVFYRVRTECRRRHHPAPIIQPGSTTAVGRHLAPIIPVGGLVVLGIVYGGRRPIVAEIRNVLTGEAITKCILGVKP